MIASTIVAGLVASPAAAGWVGVAPPPNPARDVTVTLITGDQVIVPQGQPHRAMVEAGPGRQGIEFRIDRGPDGLHVLPADAIGALAAGTLDRRLFDVTTLIEAGYDDASIEHIPLIVAPDLGELDPADGDPARVGEAPDAGEASEPREASDAGEAPDPSGAAAARLTGELATAGALVTRELPAVDGAAAQVDKDRAADVWADLLPMVSEEGSASDADRTSDKRPARIWLDGKRRPLLDRSTVQVGAPAAWEMGLSGEGIVVGVLDTGIDDDHPDLAGQVTARRNFTDEDDGDLVGHGTHVASTVAGTGAAAEGRYQGMAPGARLVDAKVCENDGCSDSAILDGMYWAAVEQGARVVNLSLGGDDTPELDPLEEAVNRLSAETGALFVVAAGNDGPFEETVSSPASADAALAVAAVDRDDEVAPFSSRGPRLGDSGVKPEMSAPGVGIVAARAQDGWIGDPVGDAYTSLDGTSMATPHVAGAAALLAEAYPDWDGARIKAALVSAATPGAELDVFDQGAGRLDLAAVVGGTLVVEPATVSFGVQQWPHDDDEPITHTLTYSNLGDEPATVDLTVEAAGPAGAAPPAGMFTLEADQLVVPPGGTASTTVTADTTVGGPDGYYTGRFVATSADTVVRTTFAIEQEVRSHDVILTHLGRDGTPAELFSTHVSGHDAELHTWADGVAGDEVRLRLPAGRYALSSWIHGADDNTVLGYPMLDLQQDMTVVMDAREAAPVSVTMPDEAATLEWVDVGFAMQVNPDLPRRAVGFIDDTFDGWSIGHLGPTLEPEQLEGHVSGYWSAEDDAAAVYGAAWFVPGEVPTGYSRDVGADELATVEMDIAVEGAEDEASGSLSAAGPAGLGSAGGPLPSVELPGTMRVHLTTDGAWWYRDLAFDGNDRWLWSQPTRHVAGEQLRERWNTAVFGFGVQAAAPWWDPFGAPDGPAGSTGSAGPGVGREAGLSVVAGVGAEAGPAVVPAAYRVGDQIVVNLPDQADGGGHGGWGHPPEARTALYADGELVGETGNAGYGEFTVAPEPAEYRLEVSFRRPDSDAVLSKDVSAVWVFTSERESEATALPMSAVRFVPDVDEYNRLPAGRPALVPVHVDALPGAGLIRRGDLHVDVSFDDGRTWEKAPVTGARPDRWRALVRPRQGAEFVSLRVQATDADGNTMEQTVLRAYALTPSHPH
ncbi:S8 family serine peptidase [Phytoactinopolyspora limicola]|uniref:S8 family serine peptidase n=1 Tax=Phytoactinopolyspora limicola TaxID=2715536 RepID=UPI0014099440|nr:S8 family serine peptidase [Phytoactinopolyspora limicola]